MATFKNPVSIVKRAGGTAIVGEGTDYTLDTPANQPLNLTPMGDSYQQTYNGKNLLQNTGPDTDTTNGVTFDKNSDGSVSATGTAGGGGAWYQVAITDLHAGEVLSGCPTGGGANTYSLQTGSYGGDLDADYGSGVNVRNGTSVTIWIIIRSGQTVDNLTFYPQLEVASSKTAYEPYVGGIPAPSPSYPQDIKVVTGQQSVTVSDGNSNTQTFTFDLKKNKVDGAYSNIVNWVRSTGAAYGNGFTITSNQSSGATYAVLPIPNVTDLLGKEVTLSCTDEGTGTLTRIFYLNGASATTQIVGLSGDGGTFTMPASISAGNDGIGICFYTSNDASASYTNIQLEVGDTSTSYTPIIELCRFGDYQDFLWTDGIKWYKHKELGKQVLASSMFHEMHDLSAIDYAKINKPTDYLAYDKYMNAPVIASCAEYASRTSGDSLNDVKWLGKILSEPSKPYFYVGLANGTTQAQAITLLEGGTIYYPLANITEEEITDTNLIADLNAMKAALSYSPTSHIVSGATGSDLPARVGSAVITGV